MLRRKLSVHIRQFYAHLLAGYYTLRLAVDPRSGVDGESGSPPLIVSLTSTEERIGRAHLAIASLLNQTHKPQRIILWLAEEMAQAPLPKGILQAQARGLTVKFRPDIRAYKKLNYALAEFPEAIIVTADDDHFYPRAWLDDLFRSYLTQPQAIHAHRAHRMVFDEIGRLQPYAQWQRLAPGMSGPSHLLMATGNGGVLYPPGALPPEVFNEQQFRAMCWSNDDIWYKAMALLNDVKVQKVGNLRREFLTVPGTQSLSLWSENRHNNDRMIAAVFSAYDLFDQLEPGLS